MSARLVPSGRLNPDRGRRRTWWTVGMLLVCVLALLVGGKLVFTQLATRSGIEALRRGDAVTAERWFRATTGAAWIDPWRPPYNVGVALYEQRQWPSAQGQFEAALAVAPDDRRCMIALNLAWSHEAEGDDLTRRQLPDQALAAYAKAEAVAKEASCDYDSKVEPTEQPSDPNQESQPEDRTEGTPQEQQEGTLDRLNSKSSGAQQQADAQQQAKQQEQEQKAPEQSEQERMDKLQAQNQGAQRAQEQTGAGSGSGGQAGVPGW